MTKRRCNDLPEQDDESVKDLIQECRKRLRAPSKYVTGSRPSTTHDDVYGHYEAVERDNIRLRRLLAKAVSLLENHSTVKEAQLNLIPDVLEDVLRCCDGLTQVHLQLSGPYLQDFLAKRRIPKARIRLESASIGVRYKDTDYDSFEYMDRLEDYEPESEYVARARLSGSPVEFIYADATFSVVASQLAARIQSAYVANFTVSSEFLTWHEANLPDFLAETHTAGDIAIGKLNVDDGEDYSEDREYELDLDRFTQLVLGPFEEVRAISVGEWVAATVDSGLDSRHFSASFLTRCMDYGIADVDIRYLGTDVYVHEVVRFCLADNMELDKEQRNLSVACLIGFDSVRDIIDQICKEAAAGRVKHGFVLNCRAFVDPTTVMGEMNWLEDQNVFAKDFDDESTLRMKCRNKRASQLTVTFRPKLCSR